MKNLDQILIKEFGVLVDFHDKNDALMACLRFECRQRRALIED